MCGLLALVRDPSAAVTAETVDAVSESSHLMRDKTALLRECGVAELRALGTCNFDGAGDLDDVPAFIAVALFLPFSGPAPVFGPAHCHLKH